MSVRSLGYWGFEVSDRTAWRRLLVDALGLMEAAKGSDGADVYRIDTYESRIRIHEGPLDDVTFIGWEVGGPAELASLKARLQEAGCAIEEGNAELCRARCVEDLFVTYDPDGVRTELFWGPKMAAQPFWSPRAPGGFVGAPNGVGHHVLIVRDRENTLSFYRDLLGLKLSDYIRSEEEGRPQILVTFMHANPRHHSLAFAEVPFKPKRKMQHFALQVNDMSAVGLAYDRLLSGDLPIAMTLGHHPNCQSLSFYVRSPSGLDIEYSWGTIDIDDESWVPRTYSQLSDWGHKVGVDLIEAEEPAGV
ncbi:MAG TPA: VOC family protein [Sphingobium sp.]|nr:VOC family protein [Sphingobium sp.]